MTAPLTRNAGRRLAVAHALLDDPDLLRDDDGVWPRSCTWLTRLALEHALDDYWRGHRPELVDVSRRAQLLALTRTVDRELGLHATSLWHELSRAAHHHAYELAPTAEELRRWHREVYLVAVDLAARDPSGPTAPHPRPT